MMARPPRGRLDLRQWEGNQVAWGQIFVGGYPENQFLSKFLQRFSGKLAFPHLSSGFTRGSGTSGPLWGVPKIRHAGQMR